MGRVTEVCTCGEDKIQGRRGWCNCMTKVCVFLFFVCHSGKLAHISVVALVAW